MSWSGTRLYSISLFVRAFSSPYVMLEHGSFCVCFVCMFYAAKSVKLRMLAVFILI